MHGMSKQGCFLVIICLLSLFAFSGAAEIQLSLIKVEHLDSFVEYPQVQGMEDALIQDSINTAILEQAASSLNTLTVLKAGSPGTIQASSQQWILHATSGPGVLSVLLTVDGRQPNGRTGYVQTPAMFNLEDGQAVTAEAVFLDVTEAAAWIEDYLLEQFDEDLSNYLDVQNLSPFPIENLLLTTSGISFYYPFDTMVWLSGRSASIHLLYHEIAPLLRLGEEDLLTLLGVNDQLMIADASLKNIEESVSAGALPGLDATLGGAMETLVEENRLQYDPEGYPEGELYQLEDDAYRGTFLISVDEASLSGILTKRMNLYGLITGRTTRTEIETLLGPAQFSLPMSDTAAQLYRVPEGTMLTYSYGNHELRLYVNTENTLGAIMLKTK